MLKDRLVAHRGYQQFYPENTLLAIEKAIEAGAHYIEIDIQFSSDGVPMIYHDATLQRVSGIHKDVNRLTTDELVQLPACEPKRFGDQFSDIKISRLNDVLPLLKDHPEVTLFVEVKEDGIYYLGRQQALDAVHAVLQPLIGQCILISFDREFILLAHQSGWPSVGVVVESWSDLGLSSLKAIHPDYLFISHKKIPKEGLLESNSSAELVVYEIGNAEAAVEWFRRGADMVESFNIGGLLHDLSHRAL